MERLELFGKVCECGGQIERIDFMVDKPFGCFKCLRTFSHEDLKTIFNTKISPEFQKEMKQLLLKCTELTKKEKKVLKNIKNEF